MYEAKSVNIQAIKNLNAFFDKWFTDEKSGAKL